MAVAYWWESTGYSCDRESLPKIWNKIFTDILKILFMKWEISPASICEEWSWQFFKKIKPFSLKDSYDSIKDLTSTYVKTCNQLQRLWWLRNGKSLSPKDVTEHLLTYWYHQMGETVQETKRRMISLTH